MGDYEPPFRITNKMIAEIAIISEKIGQISNYREFEAKPYLRRNNRIRSVHSSLAIEANSLSLNAVRGVINGKTVLGPQREIQEVKNAYRAYEELGRFDPYELGELKRLHGIMTYLTIDESGEFRRGEEGVFEGDRCVFMAPPAERVPELMEGLFGWMRNMARELHPLVLSSVFHYEFVFIHPFADGNGRMARLWQTSLLSLYNPIFQYLPIESRIHEFQKDYYAAIAKCHSAGSSERFIEFMLDMINETLAAALIQAQSADGYMSEHVRKLMNVMEYGTPYTAAQIMSALGLKSKETLRRHYLNPAISMGLVAMGLPDKPTSRNQTYIRR